MCFISVYSVLNTLSEYTYFYILKSITSYTFLLVYKIVESLQCILKWKSNSVYKQSLIYLGEQLVVIFALKTISFSLNFNCGTHAESSCSQKTGLKITKGWSNKRSSINSSRKYPAHFFILKVYNTKNVTWATYC